MLISDYLTSYIIICIFDLTYFREVGLEFVTGGVELLKAVLHGYAGGLICMK